MGAVVGSFFDLQLQPRQFRLNPYRLGQQPGNTFPLFGGRVWVIEELCQVLK